MLIPFEFFFFFYLTTKAALRLISSLFFASVSWPRRRAGRETEVTIDINAPLKTIKCTSHVINITVANHHGIGESAQIKQQHTDELATCFIHPFSIAAYPSPKVRSCHLTT